MALSIKLLKKGKSLTPYVSYSHVNGQSQRRFTEQFGKRAGACVKANVHKGMSQGAIKDAVRNCSR